jgi:hypothetical protein
VIQRETRRDVVFAGGTMHDVQGRNVRRVFAFADFFRTVEREYPRFFEVGQNTLDAMHSVTDRAYPNPEPHQRGILNLGVLAGISSVEVITLVGNGLGHGGMRILRSLLETAINIEFFRLRPETFEDYKEWFHVERFREIEFLRQHAPEIYAQVDAEAVTDIGRNMARVRPRFLARDRNRKSRGLQSGWSSLNLDARAVATGFTEAYQLINPLASSFVHETMYGMLKHFDASRDEHRVEVPPTLDWSKEALSGAHHCMVRVVQTLGQTFGVAPEPTVETLEREWHYTWTEPRP